MITTMQSATATRLDRRNQPAEVFAGVHGRVLVLARKPSALR
jgi:hypothetical protein